METKPTTGSETPPAAPPAKTTLEELKLQAERSGVYAGSVGLVDGQSFALAQRIGNMLAQSTIVPKAYVGNVGNCVIALNMASRIGADPIMVMQNLYVVHGMPSWSAQFLIACFNKCGRFSSLRYEFGGKEGQDDWSCRAWAIEKETGERLNGTTVSIAMAKKEGWYNKQGSKWQSMPQQMLMYRAASWFVRAYAPEIAMGLHTAEEIRDTYEMEASPDGTYTVEALRDQQPGTVPSPPAQEPAKIACPAEGDSLVNVTECEQCGSRQGCPAHAEPEA